MRVTTTTKYLTLRDGLESALGRVQDLQGQLSSGRKINKYSDAPADAAAVLRYGSQITAWTSYNNAANDAQARLGVTDSTLQTTNDVLNRVHDLALQAANGSLSTNSRNAIAQEVLQLRDQLGDLANTKHLGSSLFGGFAGSALTHDPSTDTWTWTGDGGKVMRQVGADVTVQVNLDGQRVFGFGGPPGSDAFSALKQLAADISSGNNTGISAGAATVATLTSNVQQALGTVGAITNRVTQATDQGTTAVNDLKNQQSNLSDVDLASATLELSQAQTAYQAALGAASRANLPSLANFLGTAG